MRRFLSLAAKIAISAALLYLAVARVDLSTIASRLQQAKVVWLLLLVSAMVLQVVLVAMRWRQIALHCGAPIPAPTALRYTLIASFFNQTLPSTVGGDAARIWFLARAGAGWQAATYSVLVDRIIGLAVLVAIVAVCLPWLLDLVRDPLGRVSLLVVNGTAIIGTVAFMVIGHFQWHWLQRWWVTRHVAGTAKAALDVARSRDSAAIVITLSVVIHLLTVASVWCAARSIAAPLDFGQSLLLVPPVILVATIPISIAGWGVREGAMMTAFAYAGLPDADGLIVSVLFGAGLFVVGMAGGAIWVLSSEQREWAAKDRPRET